MSGPQISASILNADFGRLADEVDLPDTGGEQDVGRPQAAGQQGE